jgi:uncharacterized membrane protein HdeD (DUF308 family)
MVASGLTSEVAANARRYWWLFLIRGLLGLALGVWALLYPGATLAAVVLLLGAFLIVDGIIAIVKAFQIMRSNGQWGILLLEGILGLAVGIAIFVWPGISIVTLAYLVGYWAIFSGIVSIVAAVRFREHIRGEWLYAIFGVISILFGLFVLVYPSAGLAYIIFMIAFYGFFTGITLIVLAFRARRLPARS